MPARPVRSELVSRICRACRPYHNDLARDGANSQEYALTTANVNAATFGKLFSCTVDGAIYAQPLWVANLLVNGAMHNVVFVATQHDGLFAFDADAAPCVQLWQANLIDSNHGAVAGEITVPTGPTNFLVGGGDGDIRPEVGVTGTPVIDPAAGILYVVSVSVEANLTTFHQRLHAIDLRTGNEKTGSPTEIAASYPGTGDGGSTVTFVAQEELQRPGLALVNGTVYIAWASYEDTAPYYGWLIGYTYNGTSLTQSSVFNVAPNTGEGGIWMSGAAPAADSAGNLYFMTGNAVFDANSLSPPTNDYGDSMLKLSGSLAVLDYFTPSNYAQANTSDIDFGSGGAPLLADLPAGSPVTHIAMGGGKDGNVFVVNRDAMGGLGDSSALESFYVDAQTGIGHIFSSGAFWNSQFYIASVNQLLFAYRLNASIPSFTQASASPLLGGVFGFPGSTPSVSANGNANGIVWALNTNQYCTGQAAACGPAVLHAYDASNVATELWSSSVVGADAAGNAVKFAVPTIANGKVYVGTRGNDSNSFFGATTSPSGELDVYGLKP